VKFLKLHNNSGVYDPWRFGAMPIGEAVLLSSVSTIIGALLVREAYCFWRWTKHR
jgi:hypothetical protein